ncbi:nucleotide exchange factor GrpE [soil metagenome]
MKEKDENKNNTEENNYQEALNEETEEIQEDQESDPVLKLEEEKNLMKDTLLRKVAEFENYKKRTDNEMSSFFKYASEKIIKELIPVYDDMSRSIDSINKGETKDFETLKKGIELIHSKFKKILEDEGLKEIDVVGKPFDVQNSDALMQVPSKDAEPNTVLEVVEKGYKLKDKVIKHAKVLVSTESH